MDNEFYTVRGYEQKSYNKNFLTPSMEDYVEMIYRHTLNGDEYIRLSKLADLLNVRDSSASKMMQKLGKLGLVDYEKYGLIKLTELGFEVGQFLLQRHNTIETFLKLISSTDDVLTETELIEHVISANTVENLRLLNEFIRSYPEIEIKFKEFKNDYYKK